MTTVTKAVQARRAEALEELRHRSDLIGWDDDQYVYTILRHVSKSGMLRVIDLVILVDGVPVSIAERFCEATGATYDPRGGVKQTGCGMDMGYDLVYRLGRLLYPDGYECTGERCASNDHSNGDRDYTPGHCVHRDGGYRFRHRWL